MKAKLFLLLLISLLFGNKVSARSVSDEQVIDQDTLIGVTAVDSLDYPVLTEDFYQNVTFLNQEFDYETKNKINRLNMWSREVMTAGFVTLLGVMFGNAILANKYDWSLWIDIPCASVIGLASMWPFVLWSNHLKEKAESLSSQTVYLYNINCRMDLGATSFTNHHDHSLRAIGVGLKVNF